MKFEEIKKEFEKVVSGSEIRFDLSLIDTRLTAELSKFVKFKYDNLLYLWGAKYHLVNPDMICLSGEFEVKITDTYFRISIYVVRANELSYYLTVQPRKNWLNEVGGVVRDLINIIPVSIDLSQTLFIYSTISMAEAELMFEKRKYQEYKKIALKIAEGEAIAADIKSDLLSLVGIKDPLFLIQKAIDGTINIDKEVDLKINLVNLLEVQIRHVRFSSRELMSISGILKLPFPTGTLHLQSTFSITGRNYHASIMLPGDIKLPIQTLLKGLNIANVQLNLYGSFEMPSEFSFGLAGDFAIGEPVVHRNEHDFSYNSLSTNEFNLIFKPDTNSYIPVFIQAYIKEVSLSKAVTLITDKDIKLPAFLDPIKFYSTYIYYCAPNQNSVLINGVPAKKGLAISSGIDILGLQAYAEYSSIEGEGVSGLLEVEPIEIAGILSIKGKGKGSPAGYAGPPILPGGMALSFFSSESEFRFRTSISIVVLSFLEIDSLASYDERGLEFEHRLDLRFTTFDLKCNLKSIGDFKFSSAVDFTLAGINVDLGMLGRLSVNLNIFGGLAFQLIDFKDDTAISCGFRFNGKEIKILDLHMALADIERLDILIRNQIEKILENLLINSVLEWLLAVLNGAIRLAEDIIAEARTIAKVLIEHFGKTVEEASRLLKETEYHINRIARILAVGFNQTAEQIAQTLKQLGYTVGQIVGALSEELKMTLRDIAATLKQLQYTASQIISELKEILGVAAEEAAMLLKGLYYAVKEIGGILKTIYAQNAKQAALILKTIGYGASDVAMVLNKVFRSGERAIKEILGELGHSARTIGNVIDDIFGGGGGCLDQDKDLVYLALTHYEEESWYKLRTLGEFRDNYLVSTTEGKEILDSYKKTSASIFDSDLNENWQKYFDIAYHEIAIPAVALIENGMNEIVLKLAKNQLNNLVKLNQQGENDKSKLVNMFAGPANVWGPEKEVHSVLSTNAHCKLTVFENNTNGNIRIQIKHSPDINNASWQEYSEGNNISAQVVRCRLTSTSTGGAVIIKVE